MQTGQSGYNKIFPIYVDVCNLACTHLNRSRHINNGGVSNQTSLSNNSRTALFGS